jgi:hypothetical protein
MAERAARAVAAMAGRTGVAVPAASERFVAFPPTVAGTLAAAAERGAWAAGIAVAVGALEIPAVAARTPGPAITVRIARSRPACAVGVVGAAPAGFASAGAESRLNHRG